MVLGALGGRFDHDMAKRLADNHGDDYKSSIIKWQKKLYNKGWIAPGWPKEYGGTGWTDTQKFIFESEISAETIQSIWNYLHTFC